MKHPQIPLNRRAFLSRSAMVGCTLAASPLLTPVSIAAAPWDTRLVVIVLRGGMDGIGVVQPWGAPEYSTHRTGALAGGPQAGASDLDGYFALHGGLKTLMPLWKKGELGFVHAVSTPYRDKRSHFDGQDLLEAGTVDLGQARDGWLNRMLQSATGVEARTAFAIGHGDMRILDGVAPVANWSPDADLAISPATLRLAQIVMQDDPSFHAALAEAEMLSGDGSGAEDNGQGQGGMMAPPGPAKGKAHLKVAEFAARQLSGDARVISFSLNGWDTHNRQGKVLSRALGRLAETILTLRDGVGAAVWDRTVVVAMTEFGRTVRENGTGGTDHGTGGAMVLAGGAVRGGRVYGTWPGLDEAALYARRDLMPTGDVRAPAAWLMAGLAGLGRPVLERHVFPGLDMGDNPGLLR